MARKPSSAGAHGENDSRPVRSPYSACMDMRAREVESVTGLCKRMWNLEHGLAFSSYLEQISFNGRQRRLITVTFRGDGVADRREWVVEPRRETGA